MAANRQSRRAQEVSADVSPGEMGQKGMRFPEGDQPAVPFQELTMAGFLAWVPHWRMQSRNVEGCCGSGASIPVEIGKLPMPLISRRRGDLWVMVVGKGIERRIVAVFLP